jgi:hypothetical protein
MTNDLITVNNLKQIIFTVRGKKVMFDKDLAQLYGVETKRLNEAVKRNIKRFPLNFMFQLTHEEFENLKSQFATSSWGGVRKLPYAFTEHGVTMLASVLNSDRAIEISIKIVETFITLRQLALENQEISKRLTDIENYLITHTKENKADFKQVYEMLALLMDRTKPTQIGFTTGE